ncbi:MAG: FGGY family carbohydrate kinase, partial [Anaerolineae bacterium]
MAEELLAAIDQGTTGSRCILFTPRGEVRASAYEEHSQIYPQPGWVEHDAAEIWTKTARVTAAALAQAGALAADIAGLGITNQRETVVVWDAETGRPLAPAIVWQDTRTREHVARLVAEGLEPMLRERTGLVAATYFSGPKLAWLLQQVPGLRARAEAGKALCGTMDSWLIWNLTGGPEGGAHVTDITNASRTLLMNLRTLEWDDDLLHLFGIPRAMLPQIRPSSDLRAYGVTRTDGPLNGVVSVCGAAGDQQAALVGQTCFAPGETKNTYGTGCFLLLNTGREPVPSQRGLLTTVAYATEAGRCTYALE